MPFINFFLLFLVVSSTAFSMEKAQHRAFREMKGGCDRFQVPLQAEFAAWEKTAQVVQAAEATESAPALPIGNRIDLALSEQKKVKLAVQPQKVFATKAKTYGGLAKFSVPNDGKYRVSLGGKIWVDLVEEEGGKIVPASHFEMQTGCKKIFKVVEFSLRAGVNYLVQISSNPAATAPLLLSESAE
ncbi:MAG: hypothetical protein AB7K68_14370 [Bacteriovoracia bacterium]